MVIYNYLSASRISVGEELQQAWVYPSSSLCPHSRLTSSSCSQEAEHMRKSGKLWVYCPPLLSHGMATGQFCTISFCCYQRILAPLHDFTAEALVTRVNYLQLFQFSFFDHLETCYCQCSWYLTVTAGGFWTRCLGRSNSSMLHSLECDHQSWTPTVCMMEDKIPAVMDQFISGAHQVPRISVLVL